MLKSFTREALSTQSEFRVDCGHWKLLKYYPAVGDEIYCAKCCRTVVIVETSMYVGTCDQCEWERKLTSQYKINRQAKFHAKRYSHFTRVLGTNLFIANYDNTDGEASLGVID
jgi:hypothetical protein